jgi:hypothetical protein
MLSSVRVPGKCRIFLQQGAILVKSEFYRGFLPFMLPLPLWIGGILYALSLGRLPLPLTSVAAWSVLGMAGILALIYGLQGFSSEADRQTLDFLLSRPLSPYLIVAVKYLVSLGALLFWIAIAAPFFRIELATLDLAKGMGVEWLLLFILVIHAMSFLAGIVAKGLERLFVVTATSGGVAWLSFQYWNKILDLISANFYWPDVPPRLMLLLTTLLPLLLMLLGLAVPLTATVWYVRSRVKWWEFKPFYWVGGSWLLLLLLILGAEFFCAPPLWPLEGAEYGDWHENGGIALSRTLDKKTQSSQLFLARLNGKPRLIHVGTAICKPRFAPDGQRILFIEDGRVKLYDGATRGITPLARGEAAAWARDGRRILISQSLKNKNPEQPRNRLAVYDPATQRLTTVSVQNLAITDLVWDSARHTVYLLGKKTELYGLDLKTGSRKEYPFPEKEQPSLFGVVHPTLMLDEADRILFLGQSFDRSVKIFFLNLRLGKTGLLEEKSDVRILTGPPVLMDHHAAAYIWPRFDGGFESQTSYFYMGKLDEEFHHHDD